MAEKLEVDLAKLSTLLETAGRKDLVSKLHIQAKDGRFGNREERDGWICLLARSDRVSHSEIANCFGSDGISRGLITHITRKRGVVVVPRKTLRQRALAHLEALKTPVGRERACVVLAGLVGDGSPKYQDGAVVIKALGFPGVVSEDLIAEVWIGLVDAGII